MDRRHFILLVALAAVRLQPFSPLAQTYDYPTAKLSTVWINGPNVNHTIRYPDESVVKSILLRRSPAYYGPSFACGFYCSKAVPCTGFLFAIFIVYANSGGDITYTYGGGDAQIVWSANRGRLVKENATLELTAEGDFVLRDADGSQVWSANTSNKGVAGMRLTAQGNLVLFDKRNLTVWQSFDHPTDTLLPGQKLVEGMTLTANISTSNWNQGEVFLLATPNGIQAFVGSNPPQYYAGKELEGVKLGNHSSYVQFLNGSLQFFVNYSDASRPDGNITLPPALSQQYMRLEFDSHLRIYEWDDSVGWKRVFELLNLNLGDCAFPNVCGSYGLCSQGQCSCPPDSGRNASYFKQVNDREPNLGCFPVTPLDCQSSQQHRLLTLNDVSYFSSSFNGELTFYVPNVTTSDGCKEACLKNCSCRAAVFQYNEFGNASYGSCRLPTQVFSLMTNQPYRSHYNSTTYLKVQLPSASSMTNTSLISRRKTTSIATIAGSTIGAFLGLFIIIFVVVSMLRKNKKRGIEEEEEDKDEEPFDQLPGMPKRFSYDELKVATNNFLKKLGEGGFGSVFEGTLVDGSKVAVKQLDSVRQGKREFLAEVMTIGSIHHANLARLVGFCAKSSHRLLVYEYMSNGSLDRWIFSAKEQLDWHTRKKIIHQVAKGLAYLHEDCRPKIAHFDIKPQNILLDHNFNAKVSDFGLAKLIDMDESCVVTAMRGTVGYLAPEWLTSKITEKVDVYSFGVVVTEIVCGRRNLDQSQPGGNSHLLGLLMNKAQEGQLTDVITEYCSRIHVAKGEAIEMLKLGIWCLQTDTSRRPSMSTVVKVLEGVAETDPNLNYNFLYAEHKALAEAYDSRVSAPLLASVLSGPR